MKKTNLIKHKVHSKTEQLLAKVLAARHEKFVEQISIILGGFYLNKMNFGKNCVVDKHTKHRLKFVYRPIFKRSNIS